jgi:hypothetical protein
MTMSTGPNRSSTSSNTASPARRLVKRPRTVAARTPTSSTRIASRSAADSSAE